MKYLFLIIALNVGLFSADAGNAYLPNWSGGIVQVSGTPSNGTNEIQTLTISATGQAATALVSYAGSKGTLTLTATDTSTTINTKMTTLLGALPTIGGTANVSLSTGTTSTPVVTVTFQNGLGKLDVPQISTTITSGSLTITGTTTTPGVTADGRYTATGQLCISTTNGILYQNQGSPGVPTWVKVSGE